ncbi:MAG: DUF4249 domain-containing protein [Bacteroidia bacterium]|nr:DUF4249 domain-containing protein [Bacteroidia bacterium]
MKKRIIYLTLSLLILLLAACERMLDVDFSNEKPLIVINGTVEPDKPIYVSISKSFLFTDTDSLAPLLKDVSVELHINNKWVEKMQFAGIDSTSYSSRRGVSYFRSKAYAKIGDRVRIEAKASGLETAWAETVIPVPPTIEKVDTTTYLEMLPSGNNNYFAINWGKYGGYGGYYIQIPEISYEPFLRMMRLHINVRKTKGDEPQYFLLSLYKLEPSDIPEFENVPKGLFVGTGDDPIFAKDPKNSFLERLLNENNSLSNSTAFTDNLFTDNSYTLNVTTTGYYTTKVEFEDTEEGSSVGKYIGYEVQNPPIEVRVYSLSGDYYSYLKANENLGYDLEFSYISEPATTYSNVHNGIGFLGSMSHASKIIETPPFNGKDNEVPR